jgi:hypothetical protein
VSLDDPHYFQSGDGHPLFLLGFGHPLDWYHPTKYADMQTAYLDNGLSFARIFLPWAGPDADLVAYTHQRTGPGTALDGGLKFDLTLIDTNFLDRLQDMVSWAEANGIVVAVGLWHDWPFEDDGSQGYYGWTGSVVNPSNRINTQSDDMIPAATTHPWYYDILGLDDCPGGTCWDSNTERQWFRDRVKELYDAVLQRLAPNHNWYIELGNRAYHRSQGKRYWANYLKGISHALDDGAVSPYAKSNLLLIDQPTEPPGFWFVGETDLIQQFTRVESAAAGSFAVNESFTEVNHWNGINRILYDMGVVLMATPEGSPYSPQDRNGRRRAAWQALTGGGHWDAMEDQSRDFGTTPSAVSFLPDYAKLMAFVRATRNGTTIERQLVHMQPDNSRITSSRDIATGPFALVHKTPSMWDRQGSPSRDWTR